jgi:hypothetical protein
MAKGVNSRHESSEFESNIRDQIEAAYMATRLPWQTRALARLSDTDYCDHMETVLQCRLRILSSSKRIAARHKAQRARKEKRRNESFAKKLENAYRECYKKEKT